MPVAASRDADDRAVEKALALEPVERAEGHLPGQVAGDAEDDEDVSHAARRPARSPRPLPARVLDHLAVAGRESRGVEPEQPAGALQVRRGMPCRQVGQREARIQPRGGLDAAERGEDVAAEERAVAGVEEGHVTGGVPGCGDDLERADPLAVLDRAGRLRPRAREPAPDLGLRLRRVERLVLSQQALVAARDDHLGVGQLRRERVERADVVAVGVGEDDARHRGAHAPGGVEDRGRRAPDHRVDHCEPVVLSDEVGVDDSEAGHTGGAGHRAQL